MSIILLIFILTFLVGARLAPKGEFFTDYLSLEQSNSVKGIFVLFVFFRHYAQYVTLDGSWDKGFLLINSALGQMIVVAFLFYSGYGVYLSIERKGLAYVRSIPLQRAAKVWLHYGLAVCLFLIANLALGRSVSPEKLIGTLLCVKAIGNSNWYVMAIVILYLLTYICFRFCIRNRKLAAVLLTISALVVIVALMPHLPGRYYNTLLCYPLGVWWACYRNRIDDFLKKGKNYGIILGIFMLITILTNWKRDMGVWIYELASLSFVCVGIFVTMKLRLYNRFIQYAGNHVFSLYILQRLPMFVLAKATTMEESPYVFFLVTLALTFPISWLFDKGVEKLDRLIFRGYVCLEQK